MNDTPTPTTVTCRGCGDDHSVLQVGKDCPRCGTELDLPQCLIPQDVTQAEAMDCIAALDARVVAVKDQPSHASVVRRMWLELCMRRGDLS